MKTIKIQISLINQVCISLLVLFFFPACDDFGKKKPVTSGTAQVYTTVFSKQCSEGSINIKVETVSETSTEGTTVNVDDLKVGDKVQISGTINNHVCPVSGSVSFSCEGQVQIDTNRAFVCNSGTISSGFFSGSLSTVAPSKTSSSSSLDQPTTVQSSAPKMLRGEVLIYQNGTAVSTRIFFYQSNCPVVGFICD